jgi:altronate hydrolase
VEDKGCEIYDFFLRVVSNKVTNPESRGLGDYEFVPWQIGNVM